MSSLHSDLLYISDFGLICGVRNSIAHSIYTDDHFLSGEAQDTPNTPTVKVGPAVLYVIDDNLDPAFNKPTLILLAQWYVKHHYRTGSDVSQALPQIVLGFKFEGDLITSAR